jgi:hypothetical protein
MCAAYGFDPLDLTAQSLSLPAFGLGFASMRCISRALGVVIAGFALAGCGSAGTKTVTIREPKVSAAAVVKRRVAKPSPKPSMRTCSAGVDVNEHASCPFARAILAAYTTATEENGAVYLGIESPTTRKTYALTCSHGGTELIRCRTTDAVVTITFNAVSKARASQQGELTHVRAAYISRCVEGGSQQPACERSAREIERPLGRRASQPAPERTTEERMAELRAAEKQDAEGEAESHKAEVENTREEKEGHENEERRCRSVPQYEAVADGCP